MRAAYAAFLRPLLREALLRFFGTLAPDRRASESPMAIACFRLLTFLPERPERSVPDLRSCIARRTLLLAPLPYFFRPLAFRTGMSSSVGIQNEQVPRR